MRLDKFLSEINFATRSESKKYIKAGQITVNDIKASDPAQKINEEVDVIKYNNEILTYEKYVYFMLNKPKDLVSATEDKLSKTVIDLFNKEARNDLFPVGRLDKDTVGLLLITNDGDFSHKLTSPSHNVSKRYLVHCEKDLSKDDIAKLETGVVLNNDGMTKPAKVELINSNQIILEITEGKYHQVKRMLAAVNNKVIFLKRLSIGSVFLDESLKPGEYRKLTEEEIKLLKE